MKQQIKILLDIFMPFWIACIVGMAVAQIVYAWLRGEE